jgi:hypothetical protein
MDSGSQTTKLTAMTTSPPSFEVETGREQPIHRQQPHYLYKKTSCQEGGGVGKHLKKQEREGRNESTMPCPELCLVPLPLREGAVLVNFLRVRLLRARHQRADCRSSTEFYCSSLLGERCRSGKQVQQFMHPALFSGHCRKDAECCCCQQQFCAEMLPLGPAVSLHHTGVCVQKTVNSVIRK